MKKNGSERILEYMETYLLLKERVLHFSERVHELRKTVLHLKERILCRSIILQNAFFSLRKSFFI
jgi:hypothetical protein